MLTTFRETVATHGIPGLDADRQRHGLHHPPGRRHRAAATASRHELRRLGVAQKNARPNHPTTCGKVERFQQTLKKWLTRPTRPADHHRRAAGPDRRLRRRVQPPPAAPIPAAPRHPGHRLHQPDPRPPPATAPATPTTASAHDRIDTAGKITLRHGGTLYSIGIGRTHARTRVLVLVHDLDIRIINAATGELLRELTLDPTKRYQGTGRPPGPTRETTNARTHDTWVRLSDVLRHHMVRGWRDSNPQALSAMVFETIVVCRWTTGARSSDKGTGRDSPNSPPLGS